jgi:hypothetical protein
MSLGLFVVSMQFLNFLKAGNPLIESLQNPGHFLIKISSRGIPRLVEDIDAGATQGLIIIIGHIKICRSEDEETGHPAHRCAYVDLMQVIS